MDIFSDMKSEQLGDWKMTITFLASFSMKPSQTLTNTRSNADAPVRTPRITDC